MGTVLLFVIAAAAAAIHILGVFAPGNSSRYSLKNVEPLADSPLAGKKIVFLGSSVTAGMGSLGTSFVDYLEKMDGIVAVKEAKSGTTLVDEDDSSYVSRLEDVNEDAVDALVVQLSTNDATRDKPLGEISDSRQREDFDTSMIIGAMEAIIARADERWGCPVIFYTGTWFDNELYGEMVEALYKLQEKWGIEIIDLWNNEEMRQVEPELYERYMRDEIHPTRQGYLEWWTPVIRQRLCEILG